MDNIKKALSFLGLSLGMLIFAGVILIKVEVMASKIKAETQALSAELDWEGYLYHQAVIDVMKNRSGE